MVPPFIAAVEAWLDQLPDDPVLQAEWSGPTVIASRNDVVTAIRGVLRKCDQAKAAGDPLMRAL